MLSIRLLSPDPGAHGQVKRPRRFFSRIHSVYITRLASRFLRWEALAGKKLLGSAPGALQYT
ncbi:MAG: hypothetical protein ACP5U2_03660 [Bryobacteraceae bacterium]